MHQAYTFVRQRQLRRGTTFARLVCKIVRALCLVVAMCLGFSTSANAAEPTKPVRKVHQVHWDAAWSHANAWDYTLAGIGTTGLVVGFAIFQPIRPPLRWDSPILFDADARSAMRLSDAGARSTLETTAWVIWGAQVAYPVVVDVPYAWARYGSAVARDLFWQDMVTLTIAGSIDLLIRDLSGRIRPDVYDCYTSGKPGCLEGVESTRSFPGGHLINSAAAAGLTCTQHLYMRLYGSPWDAITCATTITASATVAVFRIMSDNHWATDQIVGGALGGLLGWGIPYVMHLHGHRASDDGKPPSAMWVPIPVAFERGGGAGVAGVF